MRVRRRGFIVGLAALFLPAICGCGYNRLQGLDEEAKAAWSEVLNQYQRRFDLIPNLVESVKGYAAHERETLQAVTDARAKVGQIKADVTTPENPAAFRQFQEGQTAMSAALGRLLLVVERYPDLKANQNFLTLQAQLEGTENRIAVARKRYIEAVKEYNKAIRYFPTNLTAKYLLSLSVRENFTVEEREVEKAPKVKF